MTPEEPTSLIESHTALTKLLHGGDYLGGNEEIHLRLPVGYRLELRPEEERQSAESKVSTGCNNSCSLDKNRCSQPKIQASSAAQECGDLGTNARNGKQFKICRQHLPYRPKLVQAQRAIPASALCGSASDNLAPTLFCSGLVGTHAIGLASTLKSVPEIGVAGKVLSGTEQLAGDFAIAGPRTARTLKCVDAEEHLWR